MNSLLRHYSEVCDDYVVELTTSQIVCVFDVCAVIHRCAPFHTGHVLEREPKKKYFQWIHQLNLVSFSRSLCASRTRDDYTIFIFCHSTPVVARHSCTQPNSFDSKQIYNSCAPQRWIILRFSFLVFAECDKSLHHIKMSRMGRDFKLCAFYIVAFGVGVMVSPYQASFILHSFVYRMSHKTVVNIYDTMARLRLLSDNSWLSLFNCFSLVTRGPPEPLHFSLTHAQMSKEPRNDTTQNWLWTTIDIYWHSFAYTRNIRPEDNHYNRSDYFIIIFCGFIHSLWLLLFIVVCT